MAEEITEVSRDNRPLFVSLGMFILDELRFPHLDTVVDVPGGAGFYATLGARLFKPPPRSADVGCIVVAGHDLPSSASQLLESWQLKLLLVHDPDKPCTRGLLEYENDAFSRNEFTYVTPPLWPSPVQLGTSSLLYAASFHFLALPEDLESRVSTLLRLREEHGIKERPLIVWEPAPMGCKSGNLASHLSACALVDVFSPNRSELSYLIEGKGETEADFSPFTVETQAKIFLGMGIGPNQKGLAVVRSGEHGVLVISNDRPAEWLPTYYTKGSDKVIDPTGAGNSFLGGFAVALQETNDPREAALRGSVAASYALEQFGPPKLTVSPSGELWNGSDVFSRLQQLKARITTA
ncbi:putative pfkB family carbohydrate kinase superfamily [Rosellinia necatrix]|uniref:Putative pfkB family carbohydrate kinase superfamily n=1 Tax=Rosellinia necatrix TaxID=77044 RepID=A0A1S7UID2_ROSNE|nr:putative pfkB family carbohydrate kinase superfamily [Rosellinia necatrix]